MSVGTRGDVLIRADTVRTFIGYLIFVTFEVCSLYIDVVSKSFVPEALLSEKKTTTLSCVLPACCQTLSRDFSATLYTGTPFSFSS